MMRFNSGGNASESSTVLSQKVTLPSTHLSPDVIDDILGVREALYVAVVPGTRHHRAVRELTMMLKTRRAPGGHAHHQGRHGGNFFLLQY